MVYSRTVDCVTNGFSFLQYGFTQYMTFTPDEFTAVLGTLPTNYSVQATSTPTGSISIPDDMLPASGTNFQVVGERTTFERPFSYGNKGFDAHVNWLARVIGKGPSKSYLTPVKDQLGVNCLVLPCCTVHCVIRYVLNHNPLTL